MKLPSRTRWFLRVTILLLFFLISWVIWLASVTIGFEQHLNSLFITLDTLSASDPAYTAAILAAGPEPFEVDFPLRTPHPDTSIPPLIHYIWFRDLYATQPGEEDSIPHSGSNAPDLCIQHNPTFTVHIWNETEVLSLIDHHYAWFLPIWHSYRHPIQRVDAAKYFILYHHGGVYLDLDISCRKSLAPLVNFPMWFPKASPLGVNNDAMASRKGHPLMWSMIMNLDGRNKNLLSPWITVFWTTGPKFVSDMLQAYLDERVVSMAETRAQAGETADLDPDGVYILPRQFYSEEYTFFGHRQGGTWHGKDVAVVLWIIDRPWVVLLALTPAAIGVYAWARRRRAGAVADKMRKMDIEA